MIHRIEILGLFTLARLFWLVCFSWLLFLQNINATERYEIPCNQKLLITADSIALTQIGVREVGNNGGKEVRTYQVSVGMGRGPYCAAFQYWKFDTARKFLNIPRKSIPIIRSALANGIYANAKKKGKKTKCEPQKHDLLDWKYPTNSKGHIGSVDSIGKYGWVFTIEANTSNGDYGSQRDGSGVWKRKRNWKSWQGRMKFRGFIGFYDPEIREFIKKFRKFILRIKLFYT